MPSSVDPRLLSRLGFALARVSTVDDVVRAALGELAQVPGVARVGLALVEGGGRRLRFTASDRGGPDAWCHIDAYDEVPLTTVTRTGESVLASVDGLRERYARFAAAQSAAVRSVAAVALPGTGSPAGGLVLYYDSVQPFDDLQSRQLEASARRTAEALRRVRARGPREDPLPVDDVAEGGAAVALELPDEPTASGAARRFVRTALAEWGVEDDAADDVLLCLSEIVTNAVVHAAATSTLQVLLEGDVLTVRLRDRGGPGPSGPEGATAPTDDTDPLRVHGRGLTLVDAVADRWGSTRDAVGTTVWFVLELAARGVARTG